MNDKELLRRLREETANGYVRESRHGDLAVYKYTQACVIEGRWNSVTMKARGLVFNLATGERLTAPFEKFFNVEERPNTRYKYLPKCGYVVHEKLDGCFHYNTPILLDDGTCLPIGEIVNRRMNVNVMGWDHSRQCFVATPVRNWFKHRDRDDWLEVEIDFPYTTASGGGKGGIYKLRVTANHEFWTGSEYKPIGEFGVGDAIWCRDTELSDVQQAMIFGSMLGDSSICRSGNRTACFQGSNKVEEYVEYKKRILGNISRQDKPRTSGFGTKMYRYRSQRLPVLEDIRQEFWYDDKKRVPEDLTQLNDLAIAFWYMDDGSLSHSDKQQDRAVFSTNAFPKEDCERLADWLRLAYGVSVTVFESKGWNIRINAGRDGSIERFWLAIAPHVHPAMRYKLPIQFRDVPFQKANQEVAYSKLREFQVVAINTPDQANWTKRNRTAYDIETGTHNYFAKGVLVHNSCGIGYFHEGEWRITTPGGLTSEQALMGMDLLKRYDMSGLRGTEGPTRITPIWEIIYPALDNVVNYGDREELCLLAVFDLDTWEEWDTLDVDEMAENCGFPRPRRFKLNAEDLLRPPFEDNFEGFVVRFQNGLRVKLKDPRYVLAHKILTGATTKRVIEILRDPEMDVSAVSQSLSPAFREALDDAVALVQQVYHQIEGAAQSHFQRLLGTEEMTRKDQAFWIQANVPKSLQGCVFGLLDNKDISSTLWKLTEKHVADSEEAATTL